MIQQIQALRAAGLNDAQIANKLTADDTRYPPQPFSLKAIANKLTASGNPEATQVITRLVSSFDAVADNDIVVALQVAELKQGGALDLGNFLVREVLKKFAAVPELAINQDDVDALLALAPVPPPVTPADILAAEQAYAAAEEARAAQQAIEAEQAAQEEALNQLRIRWDALWNAIYPRDDASELVDHLTTEAENF